LDKLENALRTPKSYYIQCNLAGHTSSCSAACKEDDEQLIGGSCSIIGDRQYTNEVLRLNKVLRLTDVGFSGNNQWQCVWDSDSNLGSFDLLDIQAQALCIQLGHVQPKR